MFFILYLVCLRNKCDSIIDKHLLLSSKHQVIWCNKHMFCPISVLANGAFNNLHCQRTLAGFYATLNRGIIINSWHAIDERKLSNY